MGVWITRTANGYEWTAYFSAYGAAGGVKATLPEAKVELAIAQADLLDHPFPPTLVRAMRDDPVRFAADYPDPEPGP